MCSKNWPAHGWQLGGEGSGICWRWTATPPATASSAPAGAAGLCAQRPHMAQLLEGVTLYPQVLLNVACATGSDWKSNGALSDARASSERELGDAGRVLIRASAPGTEPVLRVMVEARDATLIGNPQNMLIGSVLQLPFGDYLGQALPPVALALAALWLWLAWGPGRARLGAVASAGAASGSAAAPVTGAGAADEPPFDAWQTAKGLTVAATLMAVFLFTDWPRDVAALVGAGVLLLSRRFHSSEVMRFVDWELLILFMGLFVVNHAFEATGLAAQAVAWLAGQGVHLAEPGVLLVVGVALSNLVSNVPAVMLLLPHLPSAEAGGLAGAGQHPGGQSAAGGLHCQPHRGRPGARRRHHHRLAGPCCHWRAGDASDAGHHLGLASLGRLSGAGRGAPARSGSGLRGVGQRGAVAWPRVRRPSPSRMTSATRPSAAVSPRAPRPQRSRAMPNSGGASACANRAGAMIRPSRAP
jgi:hypothetical protein